MEQSICMPMWRNAFKKRLHDKEKEQTFLIPKVTQGRQELTSRSYNEENASKDLACAIIMHEYPLSNIFSYTLTIISTSFTKYYKERDIKCL